MMAAAPYISSRHNPLVRELRALQEDRAAGAMILEGPRLAQEALSANLAIEILVFGESCHSLPLLETLQSKAKRQFRLEDALFQSLSTVGSPQGLMLVCPKPAWQWQDLKARRPRPVVVLDGVQDPGNAASIVRSAEAAGAAGVIAVSGTAHFFSPKALRGAMGSSFRLPTLERMDMDSIVRGLREGGYRLLGTFADNGSGARPYTEENWNPPIAIVLGQEGQGIAEAWRPHLDGSVSIPMQPPVESLNVAAAAAVLLYHARSKTQVMD